MKTFKKITALCMLLATGLGMKAQSLVNTTGTNLTVLANTTLTINGSVENQTGATLANNGIIAVSGDWTNDGAPTINGLVRFTATGGQIIEGNSTFKDVEIAASSAVTLSSPQTITDNVFMKSGSVATVANGRFNWDTDAKLVYNGTTPITVSSEWSNDNPDFRNTFTNPNEVHINNAAGVTLAGKKIVLGELFLTNGALVSNGNLVIASTTTKTGRIDGSGTGSVTGNIVTERYVSGPAGYRFFHSAVQGATVADIAADEPLVNYGSSYLNSSAFPNHYFYNEPANGASDRFAGWQSFSSPSDALQQGKGYTILMGSSNKVMDLTGTYQHVRANREYTGTHTNNAGDIYNGFNFFGNTEPSAINWNSVIRDNVDATIYYWVCTGGTDGRFSVYNPNANILPPQTGNGGNTTFDPDGTEIIPMFQGFHVRVSNPGTGKITINNNSRVNDDTDFYRQGTPTDALRLSLNKNEVNNDETFIYFNPNATNNGYDSEYDAVKFKSMGANSPNLFTFFEGNNLVMNGLTQVQEDIIVPLHAEVKRNGTHTIDASGIETFDGSVMIYLEDLVTGTVQDLRANPVYTFTMSPADDAARFHVRFTPPLQVAATDDACGNNDGAIELFQGGSTVWNYEVKDAQQNTIATQTGFNGAATISNLQAGNYTVYIANSLGYTLDYAVTVNVSNAITASISVSENTVWVNDNIDFTATANGATQYTWDMGDGTVVNGMDNFSYAYEAPGTYTVVMTASNNACSAVVSTEVEVTDIVSSVTQLKNEMLLFAHDNTVYAVFGNGFEAKPATLNVYNTLGQIVASEKIVTEGKQKVSLNNIATGTYYARIEGLNQNITTLKIIVTGN